MISSKKDLDLRSKVNVLNQLKKAIRISSKGVVLILLSLLLIGLLPYLFTTTYYFPKSGSFQGDQIYNPYKSADSKAWLKANFQVQSHAWGGITDGRKNSNDEIYKIYKALDYDIIGISDYMQINNYGQDQDEYIPIYEHGYNILKRHQVCIGVEKVTYFEFPLFQNIHHKQQIINKLRAKVSYLCLAHPILMNSYSIDDFISLRNYDAVEIESIFGGSQSHWDAVLSEGRYVTALGNDDAHDLSKPILVGRFFTMINAPLQKDSILHSLKKGKAYVVHMKENFDAPYEQKAISHENLQYLKQLELINDSIFVEVSDVAEISFIGQGGELKQKITFQKNAIYKFQENDTYIRIKVEFENGNTFYFNPLIRYNKELASNEHEFKVNYFKSWIFRVLVFLQLGLLLVLIRFTYRNINIKSR